MFKNLGRCTKSVFWYGVMKFMSIWITLHDVGARGNIPQIWIATTNVFQTRNRCHQDRWSDQITAIGQLPGSRLAN